MRFKSVRFVLMSLAVALGETSLAIDNPALFAFPYKQSITAKGTYASSAVGTDYILSGTISGTVTLTNSCDEARVTLNGVTLAGQLVLCGAAHYFVYATPGTVNVISNAAKTAVLATDNTVTLCGPGSATFSGGSTKKTAAVLVAKKLHVNGGDTTVISTISGSKSYIAYAKSAFGVHQGRLSLVGTDTSYKAVGVAFGGAATVTLDGGRLDVSLAAPKAVAVGDGADDISLSGTACTFTLAGAAAKGFKTDGTFTMTGGFLNASLSGDAILEPFEGEDAAGNTLWYSVASANTSVLASGTYLVYDSSTAYAVKAGTVTISGGHCRIAATGVAGRGIGGDIVTISGGTFDISADGASTQQYVSFLDDDPVADANYVTCVDRGSASCIKQGSATNALTITGGTFYLVATGNGGKCISADGATVIGAVSATNTLPTDTTFAPDIQASTFGAHLYVAAVKVKNGGTTGTASSFLSTNLASSVVTNLSSIASAVVTSSGEEVDYTNPKGLKAEGCITMNGGRFRVYSKNDGGEGMESKDSITFNGGIFEGCTYDDCINAATNLVVNNGYLYCGSTGNDGIDSNGTIVFNGGVVIALTASTPEVGIDADGSSDITINGGIILGIGNASNMTYAGNTSSKQSSAVVSMASSSYCGHYAVIKGTKTHTIYVPAFSGSGTLYSLVSCPGYSSCTYTTTVPTTGAIGFHGIYTN